jgi:hypothetical protein
MFGLHRFIDGSIQRSYSDSVFNLSRQPAKSATYRIIFSGYVFSSGQNFFPESSVKIGFIK